MPRSTSRSSVPEGLDHGTYFVPELGLVENGKLVDGDDPKAVQAYNDRDHKSAEQAKEALAERDAEIVKAVQADESSDDSDKE